jgi:hypothetical protein
LKTINEISLQIQKECKNYYTSKLEVQYSSIKKGHKKDNENINIIDEPTFYLRDLVNYIPRFLKTLREDPKTVAVLLLYSNIEDVKNNLANFICNNFYQNILSPYTVEENLLYVIALMLDHEILQLKNVDQSDIFLENSPCGYLLGELREKSDILSFSKIIIKSIIELIEVNNSEKKINLDTVKILKEIVGWEKKLMKENKNIENIEDIIFQKKTDFSINGDEGKDGDYYNDFVSKNKKQTVDFNKKYIPNLTNKEIEQNKTKYENQKYMKDYLSKYCHESSLDANIFSNERLIFNIFQSNYSKILLALYQIDFLHIINLLDLLLNSFISNIQLLPYSLKCICKLISIMIKKKFPDITKFEENAFIGNFLFKTIFLPIFRKPNNVYINDFIISENTLYNLGLLLDIFAHLILGKLYKSTDKEFYFTPFNWYFIEKMPTIFDFYENVKKIEFPKFIEKFVNGKLADDYIYDYFTENPDEIISHMSICYTINNLICLTKNIDKCSNMIFPENIKSINNNIKIKKNDKLNKVFKLINKEFYIKLMNDIYSADSKAKKPVHNYILMSELLNNPNYNSIFNSEQKKDHFYIKELSKIENDEDQKKNTIIKIKNYFSGLLYNCKKLNQLEFSSKNNTIEILNEIKFFMKSNEFVIDNTIPYEWYVNSLLDCLKKVPKELANNDYELIYKELENDVMKSIEIFDFYMMSDCFGKIKYTKKAIDFYKKVKTIITDINLNEKVINIIEKYKMPIEMEFQFNKKKQFVLLKSHLKQSEISELVNGEIRKNCKVCSNIKEFIKYFPNFVNIELNKKIKLNIFKEIGELNIPMRINNYLALISKNISKNFKDEEFEIVKLKLFDYVLNKLYDKIYPSSPGIDDSLISYTCLKLSWVEPRHLIKDTKNNNYDIFIDEIKRLFIQLEKEKSPRKKYLVMKDILLTIQKICAFNGENGEGVDFNLSILSYIFIKVCPNKIDSDLKYVNLFVDDKKENEVKTLFGTACEFIKTINSQKLLGISEEEYNENCKKVLIKNE